MSAQLMLVQQELRVARRRESDTSAEAQRRADEAERLARELATAESKITTLTVARDQLQAQVEGLVVREGELQSQAGALRSNEAALKNALVQVGPGPPQPREARALLSALGSPTGCPLI